MQHDQLIFGMSNFADLLVPWKHLVNEDLLVYEQAGLVSEIITAEQHPHTVIIAESLCLLQTYLSRLFKDSIYEVRGIKKFVAHLLITKKHRSYLEHRLTWQVDLHPVIKVFFSPVK